MPRAKSPDKIRSKMAINAMLMTNAALREQSAVRREVVPPQLMPGVVPKRKPNDYLALDSQELAPIYAFANQMYCGLGFPGYAYLAELAQRSEYRSPSETIANEMTRRWIKFQGVGKGDKSDKIEQLEDAFKRFRIQALFRKMASDDGFFGRAQLYIAIKGQEQKVNLPLLVDKATIRKGSVEGFRAVEAIWTTPFTYNATDPLAEHFYRPQAWYVMGKRVHASRLLTFISREVPDLLKPAYNFGGISMSQLMELTINQWLRTRNSVSDVVHSFSTSGVMTNLEATLSGDSGDTIFKRMELFNKLRDNKGCMVLDKDTEEFFQFNTPLSGLSDLQAQAQEHMSAPCHIPLVKLLGVTPAGLNASTEGELDVFDDFVESMQESLFTEHLRTVMQVVQLNEFGDIDEDIDFEYVPLKQLNGKELSEIRKSDAEAAQGYIDRGVLGPVEERERLASDPNSGYNNLDIENVPDPPALPIDPNIDPEKEDDENTSTET